MVTIQFQVWGLEIARHTFPCGSWDHSGKRGNVDYESNTQDYPKNGTASLWVVIGIARARKCSPTLNPSHRTSGNAGTGEGGQCRADHALRSSDATAEILGFVPHEYSYPIP